MSRLWASRLLTDSFECSFYNTGELLPDKVPEISFIVNLMDKFGFINFAALAFFPSLGILMQAQ